MDLWLAVGKALWDVVGISCLPSLEEVCPTGSLPGSWKLISVSQARDFVHLLMASKHSGDSSTCFSLTRGTVLPKTRGLWDNLLCGNFIIKNKDSYFSLIFTYNLLDEVLI